MQNGISFMSFDFSTKHFYEQKETKWPFWTTIFFLCNIIQPSQWLFYEFSSKTHVETACEIHDLNMDFVSSDKGFKQLCT